MISLAVFFIEHQFVSDRQTDTGHNLRYRASITSRGKIKRKIVLEGLTFGPLVIRCLTKNRSHVRKQLLADSGFRP